MKDMAAPAAGGEMSRIKRVPPGWLKRSLDESLAWLNQSGNREWAIQTIENWSENANWIKDGNPMTAAASAPDILEAIAHD